MGEEKKLNIRIGQVKDVNNRQVFSNHVLCAQFLRDYADLDILKNVQPEDIEDVTDKYQAYCLRTAMSFMLSSRCLIFRTATEPMFTT